MEDGGRGQRDGLLSQAPSLPEDVAYMHPRDVMGEES